MQDNWKVDFWVDAYALSFDQPFLAEHIHEDTGVSLKTVLARLEALHLDGKLAKLSNVFWINLEYRRFVFKWLNAASFERRLKEMLN